MSSGVEAETLRRHYTHGTIKCLAWERSEAGCSCETSGAHPPVIATRMGQRSRMSPEKEQAWIVSVGFGHA